MTRQAYDDFSFDYDKFVKWDNRLSFELPFIEAKIRSLGTHARILDAACGTGMHAIALAQKGFDIAGADLSGGMVEQARENAAKAGLDIRFEQVGFGELARTFGESAFEIVLCLGNSLPHVVSEKRLAWALADFATCLSPSGIVLIQNRNFDAVMAHKERWMEPQVYEEGTKEWLFMRFYDYLPDGTINFNIVTLRREERGQWQQSVTYTTLRPLLRTEMETALNTAGFEALQLYGDMTGAMFDPLISGNLIITARRKRS